jgi:D-tagatose-1,6-bisphosphate aldolase subunit GatZ/KbaZ
MSPLQALDPLAEVVAAQHRGEPRGLASICSANPWVLEAAFAFAQDRQDCVLVESTCHQVNQYGGYMGMTPAGFASYVSELAAGAGCPAERLILGGDHIGPNPWRDEPAGRAMQEARRLAAECVQAGYVKLHLDASMRLGDDDRSRPLPPFLAARRSADLACAAETAYAAGPRMAAPPRYVIGTEVPPPGGALAADERPQVTTAAALCETIELTRREFERLGLAAAWDRVVAVVVQPGVEFGDQRISEYRREPARHLTECIGAYPALVFEAHSTDYQLRRHLRALVEDRFAILKVGPALTFAFREAVFALALIEEEVLAGREPSRLRQTVEEAMLADPRHWASHYHGTAAECALARKYSLSDRIRYYWSAPAVRQALNRLLANMEQAEIPPTLLSQYLPAQYARVRAGKLCARPAGLIRDRIQAVLADYEYACSSETGGTM